VYVVVVDYSAIVQISTGMVTNVDGLGASIYDSRGDGRDSSQFVAVDSQRWYIFPVNVVL